MRVVGVRPDGKSASFVGLYDWDPAVSVNGFPTWVKRRPQLAQEGVDRKVYVMYSDNKGRWAITLADRVAANRNFTVTQAHNGMNPPHTMQWGVVEDNAWVQSSSTKVEFVDVCH